MVIAAGVAACGRDRRNVADEVAGRKQQTALLNRRSLGGRLFFSYLLHNRHGMSHPDKRPLRSQAPAPGQMPDNLL